MRNIIKTRVQNYSAFKLLKPEQILKKYAEKKASDNLQYGGF